MHRIILAGARKDTVHFAHNEPYPLMYLICGIRYPAAHIAIVKPGFV